MSDFEEDLVLGPRQGLNICFEKDQDGSDLAVGCRAFVKGHGFPIWGCVQIALALS